MGGFEHRCERCPTRHPDASRIPSLPKPQRERLSLGIRPQLWQSTLIERNPERATELGDPPAHKVANVDAERVKALALRRLRDARLILALAAAAPAGG